MPSSPALIAKGVDALSMEMAVLDASGEILYTNEAWRQFGMENASGAAPCESSGQNYLEVTEAADDEDARRAATGLRELLAGESEEFTLEYPCHSPTERRWFTMHASRFEHEGETYLLVTHENITGRKRAEMQARRRNERLETVAGVLSHDLRNPLAVALGFVEMLVQDSGNDQLGRVKSALERMEAIIEDALILARNDTVEETRPVDLATLAERAWENVETKAARLEIDDTTLFRADPDLLDHILENLFHNAVEHAGESVTVRVGPMAGGFYVADDGPGISETHRDQVFERGFTGEEGGSGLGLDIVTQIADAHEWQVTVTESEEGGARFEFTGVDTEVDPLLDVED